MDEQVVLNYVINYFGICSCLIYSKHKQNNLIYILRQNNIDAQLFKIGKNHTFIAKSLLILVLDPKLCTDKLFQDVQDLAKNIKTSFFILYPQNKLFEIHARFLEKNYTLHQSFFFNE